jgi:hypothetical protein
MMKQKVINATYRKDSNSFPEWMKYEFELLNEDGSITKIPAYGKDLQDALSRVVHDKKVAQIEKRTKRIPDLVWVVLWFGYIFGLTELAIRIDQSNTVRSIIFMSGFVFVTGLVLWLKAWFRTRNKDK